MLALRGHDRLGPGATAVHPRPLPGSRPGRLERSRSRLLLVFVVVYGLALVRHSVLLGYLSGRHIMALVYASIPWAAAGSFVCARGIAVKLRWSRSTVRRAPPSLAGCMMVAASIVVQMQPSHLNHLSRWGHWAAGQWLADHAEPSELVLDTRGWARFVSGHAGYDYWHVRQALTDSHLTYIVVGVDELQARAARASTLKSLLSYSATPLMDFPAFPGDPTPARSTLSLSPAPHLGRTGPVSYGSLRKRWVHGVSWTWINEHYRALLPEDLAATVMDLESRDRFHAKQGRSTARVVLHQADRPLPVYLKRHFRLPWPARVAALFDPAGRHSPAAAEWLHLERVARLGINVPEVVAAGERIGPRAGLQSFLMIAELTGSTAFNELLPRLAARLDRASFAALKRRVITEMARITATLHALASFTKTSISVTFSSIRTMHDRLEPSSKLSLIDLHRLEEHRYWPDWWRWKDLGQLLFSTEGVAGISARDRVRFWRVVLPACRDQAACAACADGPAEGRALFGA